MMLLGRLGISLLTASSMLISSHSFAQDDDFSFLEEVIATGVTQETTVFESSVSVSSINAEDISKFSVRSLAELYRSIPGIRSETATGAGNNNLTVRGIPLATGGSKYIQIQEEGLPVLQYGDIIAGNVTNFSRADYTIGRVEAIRGGSASTLTSSAPGAIINTFSKTGDDEGGSVGLSIGLDYDEFRTDFDYGSPVTDTIRFHVGGFIRNGEGVRETGFDANDGGQIRFNLTKDFDSGYVRLYLKKISDRIATYLPQPVRVDGGGSFSAAPGFESSTETADTGFRTTMSVFDPFGNLTTRRAQDHIESNVEAIGVEASFELGNNWNVENRFRYSDISGGFVTPLVGSAAGGIDNVAALANNVCASNGGGIDTDADGNPDTCINAGNQIVTIANGPNAGQVYTGLATNQLTLDFLNDDLGFTVNDIRISYEHDVFNATIGLYQSRQNIKQRWNNWQTHLQTLSGDNAQLLNVVDGVTGAEYTLNGVVSPNVLGRVVDLEYNTLAPYFDIGLRFGNFSLDVSARNDEVEVRGVQVNGNTVAADFNADGDTLDAFDFANVANVNNGAADSFHNYDTDYTSFSVGGNLTFGDNQAVFARFSEGGVPVADRLFGIAGAVADATAGRLDPVDEVQQFEIGYKLRLDNFDVFVTVFDTETEETQSEITTGEFFSRLNEAFGFELEALFSQGNFILAGNLTYTDAEIAEDSNDQTIIGNTPQRQADYIFTIRPEYTTERVSLGATLVGSDDAFLSAANESDVLQEAYILIHLFVGFNVTDQLSLLFNVNNATDEFIVNSVQENANADAATVNGDRYFSGETLNGRSASMTLKYDF